MKPKEKANELFYAFNVITSNEFKSDTFTSGNSAKQCALIAVDEILTALTVQYPDYDKTTYWHPIDFWQQVKTEIERL